MAQDVERIANILAATTLVTIFAYLLFFFSMSIGGYGGDYWGFSPTIEPHRAAVASFERENYQLLALEMTDSLGSLVRRDPPILLCNSVSGEMRTTALRNISDAQHGVESIEKAVSFMDDFNSHMIGIMTNRYGYKCEYYSTETR